MPSPVGHSLSGLIVYHAFGSDRGGFPRSSVPFVLLANLPDFDFIPGWLIGHPNMFHRGVSHSVFIALVAGAAVGIVSRVTKVGSALKASLIGFLLYACHILLDLFTLDHSERPGFEVLWPFDHGRYAAPIALFSDITRSSTSEGFVTSLFSHHNLISVVNELVILLPPVLLLWGLSAWVRAERGSATA